MTTVVEVEAGGILGGVSLGLLGGWLVVRGLSVGGMIPALGLLLHRAITEQKLVNSNVSPNHHLVFCAFGFSSRRIY